MCTMYIRCESSSRTAGTSSLFTMAASHHLPPSPSPPSPPSPTDPQPAGRLCSRIEALKKELRVGLGKELFAKAYAVLEGGLDAEHEGVGVSGGASLSFLVNTACALSVLYHSTHKM